MDPRIALLFEHLDRLIKTAIEKTIEKEYGGVPLLDYVNAGDNSYLDLLAEGFTSREDGLLVYGPYDLESVAGKGSQARNDLSLAIEPIVGDNTEELLGFRLSLRDQSTVESGGLNPFRKPDSAIYNQTSEIFFLELGEFSTLEEANNLFTKTVDVNNRTAIVSLVGDKLDEIFPNSTSSIEMALSNKGPVISERIRTTLNRNFQPDYIVKAMEQVDKEQYEQYGELLGEVEVPDTVEAAEADIVPDNVSQLETEFETRPVLQNEEILQDGKYIKGSIREGQVNRQDKILIESIDDFATYSQIPFTGDIEVIRVGEGGIRSTKEIGFTDDNQLYIWNGVDDTYEYVDPKNKIALKKFLNENGLMNPLKNGELFLPVSREVDEEILTKEKILKIQNTPTSLEDDVAEVTNDYVKKNWQDHKTTADGIVMRINDQGEPEVLLIKRKRGPHRDDWALPGGIVDEATKAEYDKLATTPTSDLDWQGKDRAFTKTFERGPRGILKYTILKELVEETGLPLPEINDWYDNQYLGTKVNRFDWDARATNGVDIGGHFYFMPDNTWQPKASDDAIQAEWKSLSSILDGETKLAFGHGEWIEDVITNDEILSKHLSVFFDDNPAYVYGVKKPDVTLGDYKNVVNKIKEINVTNKSEITELIVAVNTVREQKGMDLIPVDNSNIVGSQEKLYKEIRLNDGDPEQVKEILSRDNLDSTITSYLDKYTDFTFDNTDFDEEELLEKLNIQLENSALFEGISDPEKLDIGKIINPSSQKNPGLLSGTSINISVNENGKAKIATAIQEDIVKAIESQVEFIKANSRIKDPIFLKEWSDNYIAAIQEESFKNTIINGLNDTQMELRPYYNEKTNTVKFVTVYDGRGPFTHLFTHNGLYNEISDQLSFSNSQELVDDLFKRYDDETPVEFFQNNADVNNTLNQKGAKVVDGVLEFQTNHGSAGPTEEVLELLKKFQDKYADDPNSYGIADELKEMRGIFFDPSMKFIDPYYQSSNIVGPVFYTTTNPFVGAGYAQGNADGNTITGMGGKIEAIMMNWLEYNYTKGNDTAVNEFIEEAKKIGILISVDQPNLSAFTDREDVARANARWKIKGVGKTGLSAGTVSNIQGKVSVDNVLPLTQSTSAGTGNPRVRAAWESVLELYGDNWWSNQLENNLFTPNGLFVNTKNNPLFNSKFISIDKDQLKPMLQNGFDEYIVYDKTRPIPNAPDVSTPYKYFSWSEKNIDGFYPMFGSIVGSTGNEIQSIVTGQKQKKYNYQTINTEIYNLVNQNTSTSPEVNSNIFAEFKEGDRLKIADYLDSVHHHFGIQESIDIQEISNLLRTAEALTTGDIELAQKLSPELIIPESIPDDDIRNIVDIDTDDALRSSNFTDTVDDIVKAIDSSFNKYVWKTTYSVAGTDVFEPTDILKKYYDKGFTPGQAFYETANPYNRLRANPEKFNTESTFYDRYKSYIDNYKIANNIQAEININDIPEFINTLDRFSLTPEITGGKDVLNYLETDPVIYKKLAQAGYEVVISTGGGAVGATPYYMIGLLDPGNKLTLDTPKTLEVGVVGTAYMNSEEAKAFESLIDKSPNDFTDSDMRLIVKYMDPTNVFDDIDESKVNEFKEVTDKAQVVWRNNFSVEQLDEGRRDVSMKLLMLDNEIMKLHVAHQTGQIPIEPLLDKINEYTTLLATATEDVRGSILTSGSRTLNIVNKYAKKSLGGTLKYGGKAADKFDKYVLLPAAMDILASRLSGPGSQYETIGGALADTMNRYEDETSNSVIEMLYGNKNTSATKNLVGINIAKPVTETIQAGKDLFKEYVYDNNILGIETLVEFLKPKAIEGLKGVTNLAGLNDWVYKVKRDLVVESIMNTNNVPYTKENIDIYTKSYEENNPKEVDRFGKELPGEYENNWSSSIPDNYLSRDFRVDERIRTGDRYTGGGSGSGARQE